MLPSYGLAEGEDDMVSQVKSSLFMWHIIINKGRSMCFTQFEFKTLK